MSNLAGGFNNNLKFIPGVGGKGGEVMEKGGEKDGRAKDVGGDAVLVNGRRR